MVILFDKFNLPEDIFEIIFATKQQKIVAKLLIDHIKTNGGEIGKTEMSMFATKLHEGNLITSIDEPAFKGKKVKTFRLFRSGFSVLQQASLHPPFCYPSSIKKAGY